MGTINVAIIGVGNCASSVLQGIQHYSQLADEAPAMGLIHEELGGYRVSDIKVVAAFDIDRNKVGKDLSEAIFAPPNNTVRFAEVPKTGVKVERGVMHDSLGRYLSDYIPVDEGEPADIKAILEATGAEVVLNCLPVGSELATHWYVEQVLAAGCSLVNCIPVFIAREAEWRQRFEDQGLPLIGDDIKSQLGATIVHRALTRLFNDRGVQLDRTYQLNFGGNTDFLNMQERERLESKKISKTAAVTSQLDYSLQARDTHVSPSDYVPWLEDRKFCHIRMEGRAFCGAPINLELKLEVWDSPNAAGVIVDAIRCCKLALDRGESGALEGPCAYYMKSPPRQFSDDEARRKLQAFISTSTLS